MDWQFNLKPHEIILADPAYEDQLNEKKRPLLVISKSLFHQNSRYFVCLGITTNQEKDPYLVPIANKDTEDILKEKSQLMCKRIVTVPQEKIIKKITKVTPVFYDRIMKKIKDDILEL
ncbi:MAG: type II toxin-antitoxin system PemK/MazF family toxin [Nitrosotalea sp.]